MSIATQEQQQDETTAGGQVEDRLDGRRVWVAGRWITVGSASSGVVVDTTGQAFARNSLIVPPEVGDRVRVVTTDGAALDGYWLGQTELPAGEGPVIEATVFTTQGAIETRRASITTLLDESSCRVEGEPNPETVRLLVGQLAYVGEAARKADERFQARIDSIVEEAHQEARDRDWCSEFDDFMERMGLPRRMHEYELRVQVPATVWVTVEAESLEDAKNQVDSEMVWDRLQRSDLDMSEADIEEA